jgi:hypothetical protein
MKERIIVLLSVLVVMSLFTISTATVAPDNTMNSNSLFDKTAHAQIHVRGMPTYVPAGAVVL